MVDFYYIKLATKPVPIMYYTYITSHYNIKICTIRQQAAEFTAIHLKRDFIQLDVIKLEAALRIGFYDRSVMTVLTVLKKHRNTTQKKLS